MNKVSLNFSPNQYSDSELKVKSSTITASLGRNPYFTTLSENVTLINTKIEVFDGYLSRMAEGNKQVTAQKNVARLDLVDTLCDTGRLVQNISKGDEVMILSSGYDMTRKASPAPVDVLNQPLNLSVKPGKVSGSLEVDWDSVDRARSYEVRYLRLPKTEDSVYSILTTPKHGVVIENLIPGQQYAIEVAGVGADPRRVWSFTITSFVL
jgi:hypothetical protein